jgi:uncharacterized glyoxalase superfamily protein PhnB
MTLATNRSMPTCTVIPELVVDDVDRAARILQPPTGYPYGERRYTAQDVAGHRWTFSQTIADVAPEEWGGTAGPEMGR